MLSDLSITEGLEGGFVFGQSASEEIAGFGEESAVKHVLDALVDATPQVGGGARQAKDEERALGVVSEERPAGALRGIGLAGEANHFEGAEDAPRVFLVDAGESDRIPAGEFGEKIGNGCGFQFRAQSGIGGRSFAEAVDEGFEVEARAAAEKGQVAAGLDLSQGLARETEEISDAERLSEVHHVEQMMGDARAFGGGWFRGADVHAAIHLH